MNSKICKDLKVRVEWTDPPASMTGTIVRADSQTLVVLLAPDGIGNRPATSLCSANTVRVSAAADDALYCFDAVPLQSTGLFLYLTPPGEVRRVQRREDVRQPCLLDVELVIPRGGPTAAKPERATAVNISRGGLLIVFDGRLGAGDTVQLSMTLPGSEPPIRVDAIVVRTEPCSRLGQQLLRVALRITGLPRPDERRLCQFITRCQIKARSGAA